MEQPGFSGRLFGLCVLHDLPLLCQALTYVSHKTLEIEKPAGYLPLVRMIIAEMLRFPQLGTLFFSLVTKPQKLSHHRTPVKEGEQQVEASVGARCGDTRAVWRTVDVCHNASGVGKRRSIFSLAQPALLPCTNPTCVSQKAA